MVELYGTAFLTAYGETPSPLWLAAISELRDEQCRDGLTRLAKQPREYPANLTQFVAACCPPSGSPRFLGVPVTTDDIRKLEAPPERRASPEKIDGWLAKMRKKIGVTA